VDCDHDHSDGCEHEANTGPCCTPGENTDGDELTDCEEMEDGDPWTDPDTFNGVHVQHREQCSSDPECDLYDTLGEVIACLENKSLVEELDQYSGWDRNDPEDEINNSGYNFQPNWSNHDQSWQINAEGFINLAENGFHCFVVSGNRGEACASLYVVDTPEDSWDGWDSMNDSTPATVQHGTDTRCFNLSAGIYPIRWHYDTDNDFIFGSNTNDFHLQYCYSADHECTPSQAIPSVMLRVEP
jgi:hypothetical protein